MAVISRAIPTLLRGISQSSDALKQPDHADIQDNADSNPVLGLTKRSGFQYITALSSSTLGNVHIQTINRDTTERYVAVFSNGNVQVFDLATGNSINVNKPDGTTYLNTSSPRSQLLYPDENVSGTQGSYARFFCNSSGRISFSAEL